MFKKLICIKLILTICGVYGSEIKLEDKVTPGMQLRAAEALRREGSIPEAVSAYLKLETSNDMKYRLLAANGLLRCDALDEAARLYWGIQTASKDFDWLFLAASGLADCGVAYKGTAILLLMQISQSPTVCRPLKSRPLSS